MSKEKIIELDKMIKQGLNDAGYETIRDMISNEGMESIRGIYDSILKDKEANLSSTILIHYPNESMGDSTGSEITYSVLTGDIAFKKGEYRHLWSNLNGRKAVFQLPHHGSYENWRSLNMPGSEKHILVIPSLYNQNRPSKRTIDDIKTTLGIDTYITGLSGTMLRYNIPSSMKTIKSDWDSYRLKS